MSKAFGHRIDAGRLGLVPQGIVGIGPVDDLGEKGHCGIGRKSIFLDKGIERAFLPVMSELHIFHIVRRRMLALRDLHHRVGRNKQELRVRVDEPFDQPGAGDSVYLYSFARDPFHGQVLTIGPDGKRFSPPGRH